MVDLDAFTAVPAVEVPAGAFYLVDDVDRGDDLRGRTPRDARIELTARGRSPLTVTEGIAWLLADPSRLQPGRCFMTAGSRRRTAKGTDARVPALWVSGGTGRDGRERRGAPKLGWCWEGNPHDWLGFASAAGRRALPLL